MPLMRKTTIILIIILILAAAVYLYAQIQDKDRREAVEKGILAPQGEADYDAVNKRLAEQERETRARKEKEKILNQEIKLKVRDSYKAVTR
jgi:uncharacterized protein HemX